MKFLFLQNKHKYRDKLLTEGGAQDDAGQQQEVGDEDRKADSSADAHKPEEYPQQPGNVLRTDPAPSAAALPASDDNKEAEDLRDHETCLMATEAPPDLANRVVLQEQKGEGAPNKDEEPEADEVPQTTPSSAQHEQEQPVDGKTYKAPRASTK